MLFNDRQSIPTASAAHALLEDLSKRGEFTQLQAQAEPALTRYKLKSQKLEDLSGAFQDKEWQTRLERMKTIGSVNEKIIQFQCSLIQLAEDLGVLERIEWRQGKNGRKVRRNQVWFNERCFEGKRFWKQRMKIWRENPSQENLDNMMIAKKNFKAICGSEKARYESNYGFALAMHKRARTKVTACSWFTGTSDKMYYGALPV